MSEPPAAARDGDGSAPGDDVVERYVEALAFFGEAVRDVADHEWDLPTPSTGWDVRQLVAHVVIGEAHVPATLDAMATSAQGLFDVELLGPSPLATWRGTALRAIEAARKPGVVYRRLELERGVVTGAELLGFRITENVVHAWDLRVAVGRPQQIPVRHAAWLLDFWQPMVGRLGAGSEFAPPVGPRSEEPGDRLVALLGRTPPPTPEI